MNSNVKKLNSKIIKCNKCSRLVRFRKEISIKKRKQYQDQKYWGKPITGFGDIYGKILFVGLAPAAMEEQELGVYLPEINHLNFYINVCLTQIYLIK